MLNCCDLPPSQASGDLLLHDLGQGLGLRPGCADGAISISALQWLCNADKAYHKPAKRLATFFASLYAALARGARAVFQFYPENDSQVELITQQGNVASGKCHWSHRYCLVLTICLIFFFSIFFHSLFHSFPSFLSFFPSFLFFLSSFLPSSIQSFPFFHRPYIFFSACIFFCHSTFPLQQ